MENRHAVHRLIRQTTWGFVCLMAFGGLVNLSDGANYYINDGSTSGNFYTTEPGSDANSGTLPSEPMATLTNLLATVTLLPGDTVYIDTGVYSNYTSTISVSGTSGSPITFYGAPVDGATVFNRNASANVFSITGSHLVFRFITLRGGSNGINNGSSSDVLLERVILRDNTSGLQPGNNNANWIFRNCVFANNTTGFRNGSGTPTFDRCVFWHNGTAVDRATTGGSLTIQNSVFVGGTTFGNNLPSAGDYNVFWKTILRSGQIAYLQELGMPNSVTADPGFADPDSFNFVPMSVVGRDDLSGNIVTDAVHSVLIDFADPSSMAFTNEPAPNGGRLNAGFYGGTDLASLSKTNPWLYAVTFSDGGAVTGTTQNLRWNYGAFTNTATVTIQFSSDAGVTWSNIATGVSVTNRVYSWDVTGYPAMAAFWRVQCETDTNIWSRSQQRFSVHGARVPYYVNDHNTSGTVYTTAAGDDTADGITPQTPMFTITNMLASYNFGGHDIVYVDTGIYSNYTVAITPDISGSAGSGRFTLRGSTNVAAGGTVVDRNNTGQIALNVTGPFVNIEEITFKNGLRAQLSVNQGQITLSGVSIVDMAGTPALNMVASQGVVLERCVIKGNGSGVGVRTSTQAFIFDRGLVINMGSAFRIENVAAAANTMISNSVIVGTTLIDLHPISGDYNVLWNSPIGSIYPTLNALQKSPDVQGWWNSTVLDPKFANSASSNYFPRSVMGRYDPSLDNFVLDAEHSPLIDAGAPTASFANEPSPNGGRVNIGPYGNTPWASKSRTNAWLQALTYNTDGGNLDAPEANNPVYWTAGNLPTGATVRIEISTDAGTSWTVAQTGLLASAGSYVWTFTNVFSSTSAVWRVVYESDTNVASRSSGVFTFRNGPYVYYVNNSSTNGNVYTTAPGNNANLGTSPGAPKATIAAIFSSYTLGPGDIVYVDTGVYNITADQVISSIHVGSTNEPIYIIGSTNRAAGGTVFQRAASPTGAGVGLSLANAPYFEISDMDFRSFASGITLDGSTGTRLIRVSAVSNTLAGVRILNSPGATLERVVSRLNSGDGVRIESGNAAILHSVLWRNALAGVRVTSGTGRVTNSVIVASGITSFAYHAANTNSFSANFNNIHLEDQGVAAFVTSLGRNLDSLGAWTAETQQDRMSVSADPLFANAPTDFHLQSQTIQGRFDPVLGWVTDAVTSPLIDAGDPAFPFANEPGANGSRVNIGLYGNTAEASIGRSTPWLYAASLRDGGWVKGTATLHWVAGNLTGSDLVRVEFSPDGGESWSTLHTGVTATVESLLWDTTTTNGTVAGLWRVTHTDNPSVTSQTTNFFVIRNGPVAWYVNNATTNGNLFTSAPGSSTNWVATPDRPLDALARVLSRYDVESGDRIYVDTGDYFAQPAVTIGRRTSGISSAPVQIIGADGCEQTLPVLNFAGGVGVTMSDARNIVASNLVVSGAATGVRLSRSQDVNLAGVRAWGNAASGFDLANSTNVVLRRVVSGHNAGYGIQGSQSSQVQVRQSIIWSNQSGAVAINNSGAFSISNSVLTAHGTTNRIYTLSSASNFRSEYNNLLLESNAEMALLNGVLRRLLTAWQDVSTNDLRSLTHPPLFVDPSSGNFRLRSEEGRFDPSICDFVTDSETSPMIDAGDPGAAFGLEPDPNGSRMNMGLYGNHPEASLTPPAPQLVAISLYSGGVIRGTNNLYWNARGEATGHLVRIEFSSDGGESWSVLASNVNASAGQYLNWDTTEEGTLPSVHWRLVSEDDPSVVASNAVPFMINNGALAYYINDGDTVGDVYTFAPGNASNDGLDPVTPLPSLGELLNRYPIQPGDRIYIDTGEYVLNSTLTFDQLASGDNENKVSIIGSTNYAAGGTVINRLKGGPALRLVNVYGYELSHLIITNVARGVELVSTTNTVIENVRIHFPDELSGTGERYGLFIDDSKDVLMNRVIIHGLTNAGLSRALYARASTGLHFESGVLWSNNIGIDLATSSSLTLSNSVVGAFGAGRLGVRVGLGSSFNGDFNNLYARDGAMAVQEAISVSTSPSVVAPRQYRSLAKWVGTTGRALRSMSHEPHFSNPDSGNFFLQSQEGRYDLALDDFVADVITSPLIDAGNPAWSFAEEPVPNGGRINIGAFGNTPWASMTPEAGALTVLSFYDGGVAQGTNVVLRWLARGAVIGHTVRVRFSSDNGVTWSNIVTGLSSTNVQHTWNTTLWPSTLTARWRIESEIAPSSVFGTNEVFFAVRNTNFVFFVNDDSMTNVVYTTAPGASTNTGLSADSPLAHLSEVFARYDVEPGDVIYVDTGTYAMGGDLLIQQEDAGTASQPLQIFGSTNKLSGGTVLLGGGLQFSGTLGVRVHDITIDQAGSPGGAGIHLFQATNTVLRGVDVIGGGHGFFVETSANAQMYNCSVRNVTTNGLYNLGSVHVVWDQGLLWSNRYAVRGLTGTTVSNSVIGAFGAASYVYIGGGPLVADYNSIFVEGGAWVAQESIQGQSLPNLYRRVGGWAQATGRDQHSLAQNPLFVNAPGGDFHLRSQEGRFLPGTGWVQDVETSPLIDAAGPTAPFSNETMPNGGRANIGRFGNTEEASRTPTNAALHALSLYDGGTVRGTNVTLNWLAAGDAASHTTRIEYSPDNGATWYVIVSNLTAGTTSYVWDLSAQPSTVLARWKVVSEDDESLIGEPTTVFAIRNAPVLFYVNDNSTNGNVYTTNIGLPGNTGTTPADPKASVADVLATYDVEPEDVVYVDTGIYVLNQTLELNSLSAGIFVSNKYFYVIGSTNRSASAGGTVFMADGLNPAIRLRDAESVSLQYVTIRGATTGVLVDNSRGYDFRHLRLEGGDTGVSLLSGSGSGQFRHCLIQNMQGAALSLGAQGATWDHGVLWSNAANSAGAVTMSGGTVSFSNTVFSQFGTNAVFSWNQVATIHADYNFYHLNEDAYVSRRTFPSITAPLPMVSRTLSRWIRDYGQDRNSWTGDPRFADPVTGDFHPQSTAGRYDPATGGFVMTDTNTSLLVDSGSIAAPFGNEMAPNGARLNIGIYGNTVEASRSPSDARLAVVSLREGGVAFGDSYPLTWRAFGVATNHTLRIDFSPDGGSSWEEIVSGVDARAETIFWNSTEHASTWLGVWRVTSEVDTNVFDQVQRHFAVRNAPLALYVNNNSTTGDVYTTAVGAFDNDGATPATPRDTLASILDDYALEPGDTIYMDSGDYILPNTVTWTRFDAWHHMTNLSPLVQGGVSVTLQGSTNEAAPTQLVRVNSGTALELIDAYGVQIRNIHVRNEPAGSGRGIVLTRSPYGKLDWIRARNAATGIEVNRSDDVTIQYTVLSGHNQYGLLDILSLNTQFRHGILWSNAVGARVQGLGGTAGDLRIRNSVIGVLRSGHAGLEREDSVAQVGVLNSDYNQFYTVSGAFVGRQTGPYPGGAFPILRISRWIERTGQDANSHIADPLFADPDNGDFHPMSPFGRYQPGVGYTTNDVMLSPLIDGGQPSSSYVNEPSPNGGRVNIGLYGNTTQASMSPTNGVLRLITFNDGGSGFSNIWLRWSASGPVSSHLLTIDFSNDGGLNWTNVAVNVPASQEAYLWNSTPYGRAVAGLWRITSQTDSDFALTNGAFFRLRQDGSVPYYVNLPSSPGDLYTTAPGHNSNLGFLPSSPKASLQGLFDDPEVELEPGDVVYIDTGLYQNNANTRITIFESGTSNNPVIFRGSVNFAAGGTVFDRMTGLGAALELFQTEGVRVEHIQVQNANNGILVNGSRFVELYNVDSRNNNSAGLNVSGSTDVRIRNSALWNNSANGMALSQGDVGTDVSADHLVVWNNPTAISVLQGASVRISNSVLQASTPNGRIYSLGLGVSTVQADFNNYIRQSSAVLAERQVSFGGNEFYPRMLDWQRFLGQDQHSLSHDPEFVNMGSGDFHLRSIMGRWTGSSWTNDAVAGSHSPMSDAGSPVSPFANESHPNGGRVNIGRYGNTDQASLSRTNAWLLAVSVNDGGMVTGTQRLYWVAGNMETSDTVRVEFAADGVEYSVLASNVPAYQVGFIWDASLLPITQDAKWRVVSEIYEDVLDEVDNPFIVKNNIIVAYVNDSETNNTVYTSAPGDPGNDGLSPDAPLDNPATAIAMYPWGPGDVLYIDTGEYLVTQTDGMRLGLIGDTLKAGAPGFPITILGSTNFAAGGTQIRGTGPGGNQALLTLNATRDVEAYYLDLRMAQRGVRVVNSQAIKLEQIATRGTQVGYDFADALNVTVSRAASFNNLSWGYQFSGSQTSAELLSSVAASNQLGAVSVGAQSSVQIRNSILHADRPNSYVYSVHGQSVIGGDFNVLWPGTNRVFARNISSGVDYINMRAWQRARNMDHFSLRENPQFANVAGGDFHLRSHAGRFNPATGTFTNDTVTSWAIDAGDFDASFANELTPNGERLNIGRYGNSPQASLSVTNLAQAAIYAVNLRDGGTVGYDHPLYWLYRGMSTNEVVTLEYSPNDGIDWITVATNVPINQHVFQWEFSEEESTPLGLWRVFVESDPSVADQSLTNFTIRNGPISYFVNVTNNAGDVYATAPGSAANDGISAGTPSDRILAIIQRYELLDGDTIYVDTGTYNIHEDIRILESTAGTSTNRVLIQGSTNRLAGGSILNRVYTNVIDETAVFDLFGARYIEIRDFTIQNADDGIRIGNPQVSIGGHLLRNLLIRDGGRAGVNLAGSSTDNRLERVIVTRYNGAGINAGASLSADSLVVWSNKANAFNISGTLSISNSVLHAMANSTNVIYNVSGIGAVNADYNVLYADSGASYARKDGFLYRGLPQWTLATSQDRRSLAIQPLFTDPANDDYHPMSEIGRYSIDDDTWYQDPETSWLIDMGSPLSLFSNEPHPNGSRRNIGFYGNTPEASLSRTNEWIFAITAYAGGRMEGIFPLYWGYGNLSSTNRVRIDYSIDNGTNWATVASNIPIGQDGYFWDSLSVPDPISPIARWRVVVESDTNINHMTSTYFGLNGPFRFFINDGSTNDNIFTTAPGSDDNLGISSNAPKATLKSVVDTWDIEPEDTIFMDTGSYVFDTNTAFIITVDNQGEPGRPVYIRGSLNGSGTVLDGSLLTSPLLQIFASYIHVEDMRVQDGTIIGSGTNLVFRNMIFTNGVLQVLGPWGEAREVLMYQGSLTASGEDVLVSHVDLRNAALTINGARALLQNSVVSRTSGNLVTISGTNTMVRNNTIVGGPFAIEQIGADSSMTLLNNILVADGPTAQIIRRTAGTLQSDYNLLLNRNGAWIGNANNGLWEKLVYWQQNSGQDQNSLSANPLFADEAGRDYRLRSSAGRWDGSTWVLDGDDSPAIDAGNPASTFGNETIPNGGRINLGAYGNTEQASRSRTAPWVQANSLNDGGGVRETVILRWLAGGAGMDTNTVTLEYSADNGDSWVTIVSGLDALDGSYEWDTTAFDSSFFARWRVVLDADPGVSDMVDNMFAVRNDPQYFFVNNGTIIGPYATAPGISTNTGLTPASPKTTIQGILDTYETAGGDVIYVDTGAYNLTADTRIIWSRGGDAEYGPLVIQGSTNLSAGGTILRRGLLTSGHGIQINASHVTVRDLSVHTAQRGILLHTNDYVTVERVFSYSNTVGVVAADARNATLRNLRIWENAEGIDFTNVRTALVENVTFVANSNYSFRARNTIVNNRLQNNIFVVTHTNAPALTGAGITGNEMFIDYNIYQLDNNAAIFGSDRNLRVWQLSHGHDFRSSITNAMLHDPHAGNFHLRSEYGRYNPATTNFVTDAETSWAIGRGNPDSAFDRQPEPTAGRINLGAFGNTEYASKGSTNAITLTRTLLDELIITNVNQQLQPLVWAVNNVPEDLLVAVQFSPDGGLTWVNIRTNVNAYQEYVIWTNNPTYNTYNGLWRVIGEEDSIVYSDTNDAPFKVIYGEFDGITGQFLNFGRQLIRWRGAWAEDYRIEYSEDGYDWLLAPTGPGTNQLSSFTSDRGGDLFYEDIQSTNIRFRAYRVIWERDEDDDP